jgi:hypothetical protein
MHKTTQVQKTNPNIQNFMFIKLENKKIPRLKAHAPLCIPLATLFKTFHNKSTNLHELLMHV